MAAKMRERTEISGQGSDAAPALRETLLTGDTSHAL